MSSNNLLIVGLGNPGKKYDKTRHNCGAEFVQLLSDSLNGDTSFKRMRIGIDHPEQGKDVVKYVLSKFTKKERQLLEASFDNTLNLMDLIFSGNWQQAMLELHSQIL